MKKDQYQMDMTHGPLLGKILIFSIPLMFSGVLQLLFNAADVIVVGQFAGPRSIAAVGSTSSVVNLLVSLFIGLSVGVNVLVARFIASQRDKDTHETVHSAILLAIVFGLIFAIIGVTCARIILEAMGSPDDVINLATTYLRIYFVSMPFVALYNFGAAILRAIGDTKRPLIFLIVAGVVNVILNLIFVIIFKMDVAGVALATFTAELVSSILIIHCLMKTSTVIHLDIHALKFHKDKVIQIFKIGLPAGLQGAIFSISNILIQSSINSFGSIAMAGNAAAGSLEGFVYQSMNAIYQACVTFTSQNYGINDRKRVDKVLALCIGIVTVVGLVLGNLVYFFANELIRIYTTDVQAIAYGHERLLYICVPYFICGWMDVIVGSLRGLGYSTIPMIVSLIGACGLRVLWILTIFQYFHTLNSIYLSYPVTWIVTAAAHLITYMILRKKAFN